MDGILTMILRCSATACSRRAVCSSSALGSAYLPGARAIGLTPSATQALCGTDDDPRELFLGVQRRILGSVRPGLDPDQVAPSDAERGADIVGEHHQQFNCCWCSAESR